VNLNDKKGKCSSSLHLSSSPIFFLYQVRVRKTYLDSYTDECSIAESNVMSPRDWLTSCPLTASSVVALQLTWHHMYWFIGGCCRPRPFSPLFFLKELLGF